MGFIHEFSIKIPNEKEDKLSCGTEVFKCTSSAAVPKIIEN